MHIEVHEIANACRGRQGLEFQGIASDYGLQNVKKRPSPHSWIILNVGKTNEDLNTICPEGYLMSPLGLVKLTALMERRSKLLIAGSTARGGLNRDRANCHIPSEVKDID